eukprot:scaffold125857_cov35-Tisochrysis_lutea.AAC.2
MGGEEVINVGPRKPETSKHCNGTRATRATVAAAPRRCDQRVWWPAFGRGVRQSAGLAAASRRGASAPGAARQPTIWRAASSAHHLSPWKQAWSLTAPLTGTEHPHPGTARRTSGCPLRRLNAYLRVGDDRDAGDIANKERHLADDVALSSPCELFGVVVLAQRNGALADVDGRIRRSRLLR